MSWVGVVGDDEWLGVVEFVGLGGIFSPRSDGKW